MIIGDPKELEKIKGFTRAYKKGCLENNINHIRFLGDGDRFNFTCQRTNICCKNFSDGERIILDPYDIYRLSRNRGMSTGRFLKLYADLRLDHDTHLPIALLRYQGEGNRNKCGFLRSYGCSVYKDRPLRCRLYPLGKISNGGVLYFCLINNCQCGDVENDRSWTIRGWVEESEAEPYIESQSFLNNIFENMDKPKFRELPEQVKLQFGNAIFDIDSSIKGLPPESRSSDEKNVMINIGKWAQDFLIARSYLDPDFDGVEYRAGEEGQSGYPPGGKSNLLSREHPLRDVSMAKILIP